MTKTTNILASTMISGAMALHGSIVEAQGVSHADLKFSESVRPFHVHIRSEDIKDLRKRVLETRWPDKETVADQSQGANLSKLKGLADYWVKNYDWRKAEARLILTVLKII